jgi:hypothetical protein
VVQRDLRKRYGLFLDFLLRSRRLDMNAPAGAQVIPEHVEGYVAELKRRVSSVTVYGSIQKLRRLTRMTFDQGRDVAVLRPGQQIAFPMTRHPPIFNRRRPLTDRDEIRNLPSSIAIQARSLRSADRPLRSKMAK